MSDKVPGEKQSMDFTTVPNADTVVYHVTSQHWAHAEQIRWTLLYNPLVAYTILLLAWAATFATNTRPAGAWLPLTSLSFGGLCVSLLWIFRNRSPTGSSDAAEHVSCLRMSAVGRQDGAGALRHAASHAAVT